MSLTTQQKIIYAITKTRGIGKVKARKIADYADFNGAEAFLSSIKGILSQKECDAIKFSLENTDYGKFENTLSDGNIKFVTVADADYPESLRPYGDMPLGLYCIGDVKLLNKPSVGVIGTRMPTKYGVRATEEFVSSLAERFVIVSGMARGVDACAHETAMKKGGKTVAVLGCGVDIVYPPENFGIYRDIINSGLVISEYEPHVPPVSYNFPPRNRIISGLSRAVLVTEAGERSGTMITINDAVSQGKTVFCVPGSIYSSASKGTNRSIRECQARAVLDVNDIYEELGMTKEKNVKPANLQLDFNQEAILKALERNGEMHVEELLDIVDIGISQLNSLLVRMAAAQLIHKTKQNYWSV